MKPIFKSFFIGGFECADHINRHGDRVNLLKETEHTQRLREDYGLLADLGIYSVREGICWSEVEKFPGQFDFSEVKYRMQVAREMGVQQIWDMVHFGYPDGIFPLHPHFIPRFENLCRAFAEFYKTNADAPLYVVPFNEISYLSWLSGEDRGTVPFASGSGWEIKYELCKAAIRGIEIFKEILPDCRIVLVEPLVHIHPCEDHPDTSHKNEYQFEAMDIIGGRMCPELGGSGSYLEILGFNYYWNCQWRGEGNSLCWPDLDKERKALAELLRDAYQRYEKPIFLSETGYFGPMRGEWLREIGDEVSRVLEDGVDFHGICIYPVVDRPDWDDLNYYPECGLFDLDENKNRVPETRYIETLLQLQHELKQNTVKI